MKDSTFHTLLKTIPLIIGDIIRLSIFLMTLYFFFEYYFNIQEFNSNVCQIDKCYKEDYFPYPTSSYCSYDCIIFNTNYISTSNIKFENNYIRKYSLPIYNSTAPRNLENNKGVQNSILKELNQNNLLLIMGLFVMGISMLLRLIYDAFYVIRIFTGYTKLKRIEQLDAIIIQIIWATIIFETISMVVCRTLYNEKFDPELVKYFGSIVEEPLYVISGYVIFTLFLVGFGAVILVAVGPLKNPEDQVQVIFILSACWVCLLACMSCFGSEYWRYQIFLVLIILRFIGYGCESALIINNLISTQIGIENNIIHIYQIIKLSQKRVRSGRRAKENLIKSAERRFQELEKKEKEYQKLHSEAIIRIQEEQKKEAEIQNMIKKAEEERQRIRTKFGSELQRENSRILEEKGKLEKERKLFHQEKAKLLGNKSVQQEREEYFCPIRLEIMTDPVVACDGRTYERQAILHWFQTHNTSPITNLPMESQNVIPNIQLRNLIAAYKKKI